MGPKDQSASTCMAEACSRSTPLSAMSSLESMVRAAFMIAIDAAREIAKHELAVACDRDRVPRHFWPPNNWYITQRFAECMDNIYASKTPSAASTQTALAFLALFVFTADAQGLANDTCFPAYLSMNNFMGQSPCLVSACVTSVCNGPWVVRTFDTAQFLR
ncbi:hypothetical protein BOTBODRAFT_518220 [Botryobasidium botryosum FD-172 SS1]|uniref:Uncharacterized protein n=1 Tax=Botryobasidium botryosum (strain FD-172 SS1) TaxID=930990 RepID=A0A067MST2_BOTB1|nr:hypothetical protein BOTBODRAFT_518220 [Botryobasidium botryosum FD-172 SS1]